MPHRLASSLRSFAALLCLSLAPVMPDAHAGTYVGVNTVPAVPATIPVTYTQIPYSGGTHYLINNQNAFTNLPDALTSATNYGGNSAGSSTPGQGTHSDCSGAIQTAWKWVVAAGKTQDTDPPPTQVIVVQTCTVNVGTGAPGTWIYSTGLGKSGVRGYSILRPARAARRRILSTRFRRVD